MHGRLVWKGVDRFMITVIRITVNKDVEM